MKRALLSVYDKEGIVDFARNLIDLGWQIISTGGTYETLYQAGLEIKSVESVTGQKEILGGRVKTLHPKIFAGLLYKRSDEDHVKTMEDEDIQAIDMVVCNLYPFEKTLDQGASHSQIIEMIDIGGPSMLRAAAKNYGDVLVVTDKDDYSHVIEKLKEDSVSADFRKYLAAKAFKTTQSYDQNISNYLADDKVLSLNFSDRYDLRYGENPHQEAAYYKRLNISEGEEAKITVHHGKELSYNNYNDLYAALKAVKDFDQPAVCAIKHTNPCGIGQGETIKEAYIKAYKCDTESIFGGIVALNRQVDEETAIELNKIFLEIVIAPSFTEEAFEILKSKKNIRLITVDNYEKYSIPKTSFKETLNGILLQDYDRSDLGEDSWTYPSDAKPTKDQLEDLKFAWKAVKSLASNAVVLAKDGASVGIGQGQTKRSWAVENALDRAIDLDGAVMASDGFFFGDTVELLNDYKIKAVIQPGGSVRDDEAIELCNKYGIALVFTGKRHFRH